MCGLASSRSIWATWWSPMYRASSEMEGDLTHHTLLFCDGSELGSHGATHFDEPEREQDAQHGEARPEESSEHDGENQNEHGQGF